MANETLPLLQVMQAKGIGPRSLARLLDRLEQSEVSLSDFVVLSPEEMVASYGLSEDQAAAVFASEEIAAQMAEILEQNSVRTMFRGDATYPSRLQKVLGPKAPPVLFAAGSASLLQQRAVGLCGARDASDEGIRCAELIAGAFAKEGLIVVGGHAPGIDESAHRAALAIGGATALVLPEGILQFRPRPSLTELLVEDQFVVVSEFPPKLPWSIGNAMQRNKTVCGLVQALIVVEAGTSGGTWEAGQAALELRVPLFVLDFPKPAASAQGNALLLRKGGQPLPCPTGGPPDLTLLREALNANELESMSKQHTLF